MRGDKAMTRCRAVIAYHIAPRAASSRPVESACRSLARVQRARNRVGLAPDRRHARTWAFRCSRAQGFDSVRLAAARDPRAAATTNSRWPCTRRQRRRQWTSSSYHTLMRGHTVKRCAEIGEEGEDEYHDDEYRARAHRQTIGEARVDGAAEREPREEGRGLEGIP